MADSTTMDFQIFEVRLRLFHAGAPDGVEVLEKVCAPDYWTACECARDCYLEGAIQPIRVEVLE